MEGNSTKISKAEAAKVLHRAGLSQMKIDEILDKLEDPIDLDRDHAVLDEHGVNRDALINNMGGSP